MRGPRPLLLALVALAVVPVPAPAQSILYHLVGDSQDDGFGDACSSLGDVNGDGRPDFVVGAPRDDDTGSNAGSARIFSGSDGLALYTLFGSGGSSSFGLAVAGIGDLDGDGRGDLVVGEPNDSLSSGTIGKAWVFSGIDGSVIRVAQGGPGEGFGMLAAGLGDVDRDGTPDYAVGALLLPPASSYARIYSGVDGTLIRTHFVPPPSSQFGLRIAGAGDIDGDGAADYLLSSPFANNTNGFVQVISGLTGSIVRAHDGSPQSELGQAMCGLDDLDGDGRPEYVLGAPRAQNLGEARIYSGSSGILIRTIACGFNSPSPQFGRTLAPVWDWNGDGLQDLVVGAYQGSITASDSGRVQVFSAATGALLATFDGWNGGWGLGVSLASVGDANGDGQPEFIAGVRQGFGRALVFSKDCGSAQTYCVGAPNSVGSGARIGHTGSISFAANDLVLTASECPPGKTGLFLYSFDQTQTPFADGFMCIAGQATVRLQPAVTSNANGVFRLPVDLHYVAPTNPVYFYPGANPKFQLWYRDPQSSGAAHVNTSDGLSMCLCE